LDLTLCVFHMRPVLFHGFLEYLVWKSFGVEEHNAPWNHQCAASTQQLPMPWGWHAISKKNARMCMSTSSKGSRPNRKIGKTHTTGNEKTAFFNTVLGISGMSQCEISDLQEWFWHVFHGESSSNWQREKWWAKQADFAETPFVSSHRKSTARTNEGGEKTVAGRILFDFKHVPWAVLHAFHSELLILCPCCAGAKSGNIAPKSTHRPIKSWWPGN